MPTYRQTYRLQFKTVEINGVSEQVTVDITDMASSFDTPPETIFLEGTGSPLRFETVNNGRDPFQPIIARNAVMQFLSSADYSSRTFAAGTDDRFRVTASVPSATLFEGFLLMDEVEERFINPAAKNEVTIVATDNIGTLKELELIDNSTGLALTEGHYSLLYYVQSCLKRTGLGLNLNIAWNIFEEHFSGTSSPLAQAFLYSPSFEKTSTTKEDCYTVLQKILTGLKARLFQWGGEWWIVRIHEYRADLDTLKRITYAPDGTVLNALTNYSVAYSVQAGTGLFSVGTNGRYSVQRQHKFDKDSSRFETPNEVPQNRSFVDGAQNFVLDPYRQVESYANSSSFPSDGKNAIFYRAADTGLYYQWNGDSYVQTTAVPFNIAHWTFLRSSGFSYTTADVNPFIRRTYDMVGAETSREVVLPAKVSTDTAINQYYLVSEEVPVHHMDRVSLAVDFRIGDDIAGPSGTSSTPVLQIRFTGEDGTKWLWTDSSASGTNTGNNRPRWVNVSSPGTFINTAYFIWHYWDVTFQNDREWQSISADLGAVPRSGTIQIAFVHAAPLLAYDMMFSNLQFTYVPYINGTYQRYGGQSNTVTQTTAYKANRETELQVYDGPKKLFKGVVKRYNGAAYVLPGTWTDAFDDAAGANRVGKLLVYDTWNQYRKERDFVSLTVKGFMPRYSFLLSKMILADYSTTKRFICLKEDYNVKRLEGNCDFLEVFDTGETNDYTTHHEFKYEQ